MPQYQYRCQNCQNETSLTMKIAEYLEFKKVEHACEICEEGKIIQVVHLPHSKIYKDKEAILVEAREEAKKVVEQINRGDERTFIDIYGDRPNPLKDSR